jgi:hypothetical protein
MLQPQLCTTPGWPLNIWLDRPVRPVDIAAATSRTWIPRGFSLKVEKLPTKDRVRR